MRGNDMKIKYILLIGTVILIFSQVLSFATGGGIVLKIGKDKVLQKWDNSFMAPQAGTNLEFFVGSAPAPNTGAGSFNMDNVTDYPDKVQYDYSDAIGVKTPVINGSTIVLRIWDGAMHVKGSHYGKAGYQASKDAPATQYDVAPFKTTYYAWEPKNQPAVSDVLESNQRIRDTKDVVLNLSWSYSYSMNTTDGDIEKTGYIVAFWKEGEQDPAPDPKTAVKDDKRIFETTSDSFSLPAKDALNKDQPFGSGTYHFKVLAKNWFGNGPWSNTKDWTTLSGEGPGVISGQPVTFTPTLKAWEKDKLVINNIAPPKAMKASELETAINKAAGETVVVAIGKWVPADYGSIVYVPKDPNNKDFDIAAGEGVQVYLTKTVTVILDSK